MKICAVLEFDLADENGTLIKEGAVYVWAAEAIESAIRSRLLGSGFLGPDTFIGTCSLDVQVIGEPIQITA